MLVRATDKYEKLNLKDNELNRIPKEGEQWEVSGERYEILKGNNTFKTVFVEAVETVRESIEVETAAKKVKTEKAVKKTTKKAK